jgi:hypothetical protein
MTVYVTQQPIPNRHNWIPDLSPAAKYGAIKYVFPSDCQIFQNTIKAVEIARDVLANFNPKEDFICWPTCGDPASLYIILMILGKFGHDNLTYLYWNRERNEDGSPRRDKGNYLPLTIKT